MPEFALPWALLLLPLPILIHLLVPPRRRRVRAVRVPFFEQVVEASGAAAGDGALVLSPGRGQLILACVIWVLLVLGLAKPEYLDDPITRTEAARDVMLAVDLSGSMAYRDFPNADGKRVSRLEAVQGVVSNFIAGRDSDRVGLIVFGDRAYIQLPFTRDLATAKGLVDLMEVAMAGPQTALGDAIGLAIHAFESSEVDDRVLILLTDGNDTVSRMTPINASAIAAREGVAIYTIGIGDRDATGEDRVDFDTLGDIARRTGGAFFNAEDEGALADVYARIDALAAVEVRGESWRPRRSAVHWPTTAALLLMIFACVASLLRDALRHARRRGL